MKRSWFYENSFFYTVLALVLIIHLVLMVIRYQMSMEVTEARPDRSVPAQVHPPIKIKILDDPVKSRQIVQSDDDGSEAKRPHKADAYLSDKDRSFERETRARLVDRFNRGGGGGEAVAPEKKSLKLSDLGAFAKNHHPLKVAAEELKKERVAGSRGPGRGVSASNDHLLNVPLGDLTYLNTVEYKYYGFFHRIRQKLEQFWGRSIQEKAESIMKEGRRIASDENLTTALVVILNTQGKITDIVIKGSSGIKELDDAAIESFNEAGPFPNPPKGLVQNGQVKIEWGFVVNT